MISAITRHTARVHAQRTLASMQNIAFQNSAERVRTFFSERKGRPETYSADRQRRDFEAQRLYNNTPDKKAALSQKFIIVNGKAAVAAFATNYLAAKFFLDATEISNLGSYITVGSPLACLAGVKIANLYDRYKANKPRVGN